MKVEIKYTFEEPDIKPGLIVVDNDNRAWMIVKTLFT
jgi:hypothetical protein